MATACVDANIVVSLCIREDFSVPANELWTAWSISDTTVVGPPLLIAEVASVLRKSVYFGRITADEGDLAFEALSQLPISINRNPELPRVAWELARRFNRPNVYDAFYVAAAQIEGCDLWTADRRMVNSFRLPNVRLLDEAPTAG